MADIFISYSKQDRRLAAKLSTWLEAQGWTTWWDTGLVGGEDFRKVIMAELEKARAVIVIWTDSSIESDWVRSEAGRAQQGRKLIPVKLAHLRYKDIPPPFDVLQTDNIRERAKIKAAVQAKLNPARSPVSLSPLQQLIKAARHEVFAGVGTVGCALTLFAALAGLVKMAGWAAFVVKYWHQWTTGFWMWLLGWIGLRPPASLIPILTFSGLFLTSAAAILWRQGALPTPAVKLDSKLKTASTEELRKMRLIVHATLAFGVLLFFIVLATDKIFERKTSAETSTVFALSTLLLFYVNRTGDVHLLAYAIIYFLFGCFFLISGGFWFAGNETSAMTYVVAFVLLVLAAFACTRIAAPRLLNRRLLIIAVVFSSLALLNEASKLAPYLEPPR
jgi:hypothetical protein